MSRSLITTFGAVMFSSLRSSSTKVTIAGFFRLGLLRFSPRRSRNGSRCGESPAVSKRLTTLYTIDFAVAFCAYGGYVACKYATMFGRLPGPKTNGGIHIPCCQMLIILWRKETSETFLVWISNFFAFFAALSASVGGPRFLADTTRTPSVVRVDNAYFNFGTNSIRGL